MSDIQVKTAEELRLEIALQRGFRPAHHPAGIKLLRPLPQSSAFAPPRSQEAPDWPNDVTAAIRLASNEFSGLDQRLLIERRGGGEWRCEIHDGQRVVEGRGETCSLAVCRAYLLAKTAEE